MNCRRFRSTIGNRDANKHVVGRRLGVLGEHVEIAIFIERPRIDELVLWVIFAATPILLHQPGVGKLALRVLVQGLHVGVSRRRVEIVVALLYVFAMVALGTREAEQ